MTDSMKEAVRRQFSPNAALYATSAVHAKGSDLALLPAIAGLTGDQLVLDVATATGHTALALAPFARAVIGIDLTPAMLDEARRLTVERGVTNLTFQEGDAEALPFAAATFDVVTCRIAAHHFPAVERFCQEAARVLKPGGRLLVVDNVAPEEEALDRFINDVERLRDPSHFRAHRLSDWQRYMEGAGFRYSLAHRFTTVMDREDWLARMNVPAATADQIRRLLQEAPPEAAARFEITATSFTLQKAVMVGTKN